MISRREIRRIPDLYKSIERDREQLLFLSEKATAVPSTIPDHERVQTSVSNNSMRYVDAAVDLGKEIQRKEAELHRLQSMAGEYIATIEGSLPKRIMKLRYLKCYNWDDIAEITGYAERHIHRIEAELVRKL